MIERIAKASVACIGAYLVLALLGDLLSQIIGHGKLHLFLPAVTAFVAFFFGARIGGKAFIVPALVIFIALQVIGAIAIANILQDIASVAGQTSAQTWVDILVANWAAVLTGFSACVVALLVGRRTSAPPDGGVWDSP